MDNSLTNARFCTSCGKPLEPNAQFCTACGSPVVQPQEEKTQPEQITEPVEQHVEQIEQQIEMPAEPAVEEQPTAQPAEQPPVQPFEQPAEQYVQPVQAQPDPVTPDGVQQYGAVDIAPQPKKKKKYGFR